MAVVTPTDRPKSVRNRCVIELFCVVTLPDWHFCWFRGFGHSNESDLFLFLLQYFHASFFLDLMKLDDYPSNNLSWCHYHLNINHRHLYIAYYGKKNQKKIAFRNDNVMAPHFCTMTLLFNTLNNILNRKPRVSIQNFSSTLDLKDDVP